MRYITILLSMLFIAVVRPQLQEYCKPTSPDIQGPFFIQGAPIKNHTVCENEVVYKRLVVSGRVTDEDCQTGIRAIFDVWQANETAQYSDNSYICRSKIITDPDGYFKFSTIYPAQYLDGPGYRPAHLHYMVSALEVPGYDMLTTQMYFKNDTFLGGKDSCHHCNSGDPTLQTKLKLVEDGHLNTAFNIVLKKRTKSKMQNEVKFQHAKGYSYY